MVNVGSIVSPVSPIYVHIGGIIKFEAKEIIEPHNEKWFSLDTDKITINPLTGTIK